MANPTIEQLQNNEQFELLVKLRHHQIKEFVIERLSEKRPIITFYKIYQFLMLLLGFFFFSRSILLAFQQNTEPLFYSIAALVFCFSVLIVIHEILHGIALKFAGAKNINFGGYLKKLIFYAEADKYVLNQKQFAFIALTPLIVIKIITLIGLILFFNSTLFYFWIFVMSIHSLFCVGDIGLLSVFYKYGKAEIYTFDIRAEKTSYYYRRK